MTGHLVEVSAKRVVEVNFTEEVVLCCLGKEIEYLNHDVNRDVVVRDESEVLSLIGMYVVNGICVVLRFVLVVYAMVETVLFRGLRLYVFLVDDNVVVENVIGSVFDVLAAELEDI